MFHIDKLFTVTSIPVTLVFRSAKRSLSDKELPKQCKTAVTELARLAEGYSGAEIKLICNSAGKAALERLEREEERGAPRELTTADLKVAMERTPRNITKSMVDGYEAWSRQFKKTL